MTHAMAEPANDRTALKGVRHARAVFDVRVPDQDKLLFNLKLIQETFEGIRRQKTRPEMIVTFRGPGVKFLTKESADEELLTILADLRAQGVRFEVCNVALRIFKLEDAPLTPDVVKVGNVLTSLIAYQNKGFALVALN